MDINQKDVDNLKTLINEWDRLSSMDNRELAWVILTVFQDDSEVLGRKGLIIDEVVERLYPEWDGETVKYTDTGWITPDGEINYLNNGEV